VRIFLFLLALLIFLPKVYAATFFDFVSSSYLLPYDVESAITMHFSLAGYTPDDFSVRPVVSDGAVYIFSDYKDDWISGTDLWTQMPVLQKELRLKMLTPNITKLHFQIQDRHTGQVYETQPKTFYSYALLQKYLPRLQLKRW
jgi:hypothetical protein